MSDMRGNIFGLRRKGLNTLQLYMQLEQLRNVNLKITSLCSLSLRLFGYSLSIHLPQVHYDLTNDQLPDGLIAQLVEHCTGIANPVEA